MTTENALPIEERMKIFEYSNKPYACSAYRKMLEQAKEMTGEEKREYLDRLGDAISEGKAVLCKHLGVTELIGEEYEKAVREKGLTGDAGFAARHLPICIAQRNAILDSRSWS